MKAWSAFTSAHDPAQLSYKPRVVLDFIRARGASFFDDIADGVRLLPAELEQALAELVSLGLVTSDSFGGLRALLLPSSKRGRSGIDSRGRRRLGMHGMSDAGRWAVVRATSKDSAPADPDAVEHVVRTLLRRYGVIFWRLLAREADWLPSWRDILMCCRRLEARGEIRGGRFVAGFAGEQFASPEAVGLLRDVRRRPHTDQYMSLSGADPLNLLGIVTPGARVPSLTGNRVLFLDGLPLAALIAGEISFLETLDGKRQWFVRNAILRRTLRAEAAPVAAACNTQSGS
jgi:ATP-dependent Lhr-like helicase